jgi:hypothetical protein
LYAEGLGEDYFSYGGWRQALPDEGFAPTQRWKYPSKLNTIQAVSSQPRKVYLLAFKTGNYCPKLLFFNRKEPKFLLMKAAGKRGIAIVSYPFIKQEVFQSL